MPRALREGSVIVLPRPDKKTIDVFTQNAWEKHTVFEVTEGKIRFVKGVAITPEEFQIFKSTL